MLKWIMVHIFIYMHKIYIFTDHFHMYMYMFRKLRRIIKYVLPDNGIIAYNIS